VYNPPFEETMELRIERARENTEEKSPLIFLKRFRILSSSNGREPQRIAYKITPQLHTSTSGPA
jgi:hypothetical protein